MKLKQCYLAFLFVLVLMPSAGAQSVQAVSSLQTDSILIGEHLTYTLDFKMPLDFTVEWPVWKDTLAEGLEILQVGEVQEKLLGREEQKWLRQELLITAFDAGTYSIPGIELSFSPGDDSVVFHAQTNPLLLQVHTVQIDTTQTFKPIKGPVDAPIGFWEVFPWVIGVLGFLFLILLVVWFFWRRGNKEEPEIVVEKPGIPPHIIALDRLEALRQQKLWQAGKLKEYHSSLSEIVRAYIDGRFGVHAIEMTTDEILAAVDMLSINQDACAKLGRALQLGDMVKFAKAEPSGLENDLCLSHIVDFVNESHGMALEETDDDHAEKFDNEHETNENKS